MCRWTWSVLCVISSLWTATICENAENKIYEHLFRNYSRLVRPVVKYEDPVDVYLGISLQQLVDVDEKNQIIVVNVWLQLEWTDEYMTWDPNEYGGVTDIRLPSADNFPYRIWKPDVILYNSVAPSFDSTYQSNMIVYNNSAIAWIPPGIVSISCQIDIKWFPFDDQWCFFHFGSWTYSKSKLRLNKLKDKTFDRSEYLDNGEWELLDRIVDEEEKIFQGSDEPFSSLVFKFRLRRKTFYYGYNMILPGLFISLITLLGFALPVECGEKITLEITIIPSICVFMQMISNVTPPTSEAIPLLGVFFTFHMFIVSVAVVTQVLVLNLHYRSPATHHMSPTTRYIMLNWLPWLMAMKRPGHTFDITRKKNSGDDESDKSEQSNGNLDDRINYCVQMMITHPDLVDKGYQAVLTTVQRIQRELKFITDCLKRQDDADDEENDWKFAAIVIDRLCLYIFSVFLVVGTLIIVFSAPRLS